MRIKLNEKKISRRAMLGTTAVALAMPAFIRSARAEAKVIRISTPGGPDGSNRTTWLAEHSRSSTRSGPPMI